MDLKPEVPAKGIMTTNQYPGYESYRVPCSCGSSDDDIEFVIESDGGEVTVVTYTTQKTAWWNDPFKQNKSFAIKNEFLYQLNYYVRGFLNALSHRLRITWDVWVRGHVKYSQSTIMTPQQALNYSNTLRQAVENVVAQQKQQHQEQKNATT